MRALRWHGPRDLRLADLAEDALEPGQVRIRVAYCGICGSDVHEYVDGPHAIPVRCPHPISGRHAPLTLGHEFSGTVVESAHHALREGTRVAVEPEYRCGHCIHCRAGHYNRCKSFGFVGLMGDGAMAETVVVPAYMVHVLPEDVRLDQAAMLEPAAVAFHAIRNSDLQPGGTCAVFGLGPVGLLIVALLRRCGYREITAVDVHPSRLDLAASLGASSVVDASLSDSTSAILASTGGHGAHIAFEAAGTQGALEASLACLRKGGELVQVGLTGKARLDMSDVVNRELRITGSVGYRNVFPDLIHLTARGLLDPSAIVSRKVPLDRAIHDGFEALLAEKRLVKVLVSPHGMES